MRSSLYKLPPAIRFELNRRLRESDFGCIDEHVTWLTERGHEISRSALHRYAQLTASEDAADSGRGSCDDAKLRCAEAICAAGLARDIDELITLSERLLAWTRAR